MIDNLCLRRYYVGLGLSSAVLLILVCFSLGVFYGMCGKRPGGLYGDECCNKVPHYSSFHLFQGLAQDMPFQAHAKNLKDWVTR
jgi:hypothetical protein